MALYLVVNVVVVVVLGRSSGSLAKPNLFMLVDPSTKTNLEESVTMDKKTRGGWDFHYTTRDIVIIAVIAAIAGVVNAGVGNIWSLVNSSLGPLGGALLQGAFMWAYILAMWLVRKPGAALLVGVIESSVEVLLGNPAGIGTLGWGSARAWPSKA